MGNDTAIRAAAMLLLLAVVGIVAFQWGRGQQSPSDTSSLTTATAGAGSMAGSSVTAAGNAAAKGPGSAKAEDPLRYMDPNNEPTDPSRLARHLPAGGGFKEGEEGKAGEENLIPGGQSSPELLWGKEGESSAPSGTSQGALGLCWKRTEATKTTSYDLQGKTSVATGALKDSQALDLVVVDTPLSKWRDGGTVRVFDVATTTPGSFSVQLEAPAGNVYLCAIGPADPAQVRVIGVGGCLSKPLSGKGGLSSRTTGLTIKATALPQDIALVGTATSTAPSAQRGRVPRLVQGKAQAPGIETGGFFVVAGAKPILDEQQSLATPSAFSFVDEDGSFELAYLAEPTEPLFLCAMGLPVASQGSIGGIEGQGCTRVQVPPTPGPTGAHEIVGASVTVNPEKMPLAPHEQKHLGLLQHCTSTGS